jgi:mannosyl-3-phosphoglycerate phosphatase
MKLIVFTDLDGSLLDHETYSYRASMPALEFIRKREIPLIFVTSKTRPETERLQLEMGISEPFIIENGAAVYFPSDYMEFNIDNGDRRFPYIFIRLGVEYAEIRKYMESVKERFRIRGFGDMSEEEILSLAGLTLEQAGMAKKREFTEPFIINDMSVFPELEVSAKSHGFKITRGGRFYHFIGENQDKGKAVRITADIFSENIKDRIISVGIGDSANDISMLGSVDIPVLIPHQDGSYENLDLEKLIRAVRPGSEGWNMTMMDILDQFYKKSDHP